MQAPKVVRDGEALEGDEHTTEFPRVETETTPACTPYDLMRSSSLLRGCIMSKRSLKLSSRSRWSSVSSAQTSSRTLTDRKRSRTCVSRCSELIGAVSLLSDGVYDGEGKVELQRKVLYWMTLSLRLVNRSFYIGASSSKLGIEPI